MPKISRLELVESIMEEQVQEDIPVVGVPTGGCPVVIGTIGLVSGPPIRAVPAFVRTSRHVAFLQGKDVEKDTIFSLPLVVWGGTPAEIKDALCKRVDEIFTLWDTKRTSDLPDGKAKSCQNKRKKGKSK